MGFWRGVVSAIVALTAVLAASPPTHSEAEEPTVIASTQVGDGPRDIVVNPITNRVYVLNTRGESLSIIEGESNSELLRVSIPKAMANTLAVNPRTNTIYAAGGDYLGAVYLYVLDGETHELTTRGMSPYTRVAVDSQGRVCLFGAWRSGWGVRILNPITLEPIGYYAAQRGSVNDFADDFLAKRAYVPTTFEFYIYDARSLGLIDLWYEGDNFFDAAFDPVTRSAYFVHSGFRDEYIGVFDTGTNGFSAQLPIRSASSHLRLNSLLGHVYVLQHRISYLLVIDASTNSERARIPLGGAPYIPYPDGGFAVNECTGRVYVPVQQDDIVPVIDGETETVVATVSVDPWPLTAVVNRDTGRVYVSHPTEDRVTVIQDVMRPCPWVRRRNALH